MQHISPHCRRRRMSLSVLREAAGLPLLYRQNGNSQVPSLQFIGGISWQEVEQSLKAYKWRDADFLLTTYPKNGTHFVWEIMMMLLSGKAEYFQESKMLAMVDIFPVDRTDQFLPSPRVLNSHYRLDCLPNEFQNRKTVLVIRNPKDVLVSDYYHTKMDVKNGLELGELDPEKLPQEIKDMKFSEFFNLALNDKQAAYGTMLDYLEYMWSLKDRPNVLVLFFEDIKRNPITNISRLNDFMGTGRDIDLIEKIADKTNFKKMKLGKAQSEQEITLHILNDSNAKISPEHKSEDGMSLYRRGEIGDWKNHFTVAENEEFDLMLDHWQEGKNIPFIFE